MDNTLWWPLLSTLHVLLFFVLLAFRRGDHPWLLGFFGVTWAMDLACFLVMPGSYGGLDLLALVVPREVCRSPVFFMSYAGWVSYWIVPALAAERLRRARLRRAWWPLIAAAAVALVAATWAVQAGALDRAVVLGALHYSVEPLLLGLTLYNVIRYLAECLREARAIDLLALALMLELTNLALKLLFALRPSLSVDQSFSALYHVVSLVAFFGYYAVTKARARSPSPASP